MVGILADEMTGPAVQVVSIICKLYQGQQRTRIISVNGGLHERLHPITGRGMLVRGKRMGFVQIVNDPESVFPRVDRIIGNDFISMNINISFHFGFLFERIPSTSEEQKPKDWGLTVFERK